MVEIHGFCNQALQRSEFRDVAHFPQSRSSWLHDIFCDGHVAQVTHRLRCKSPDPRKSGQAGSVSPPAGGNLRSDSATPHSLTAQNNRMDTWDSSTPGLLEDWRGLNGPATLDVSACFGTCAKDFGFLLLSCHSPAPSPQDTTRAPREPLCPGLLRLD